MVCYSLIAGFAKVVISRDIQKSTVLKARTMTEAISILTLWLPSLSLTPLISTARLPKHDLSFFNLLFYPFH